MKEREAQEIVRMVESNWHFDLGDATRRMWRQEIMLYDVALVTKALAHLAKRQAYKITLADFSQTIEMFARNVRDELRRAEDKKALETGRHGWSTPEWVWVWMWARQVREPVEERSFPQMADFADPMQTMTTMDYDALREEWAEAGGPKGKIAAVRAL